MNVSIIIISYNTCALLCDCLTSVRDMTCSVDYEIFVVDNASNDGSCEMVEREFPEVNLIKNLENRGFARANNQAILMAQGEYVLLLNSDTILENNAIGLMHEFMLAHPRAAVCGPLLLNSDKTVQRSIDTHHTVKSLALRLILGYHRDHFHRLRVDKYHPDAFDYSRAHKVTDGWLTGAVLMIRKTVCSEVGLLDEAYHFMMEDADWGLAVSRSGWETWFIPEAVVTHLLGGSRNSLSEKQEVSMKVRSLRQHRYYVRKNLGLVRYGLYRVVASCFFLMNAVRRVFQVAASSPEKRPQAVFKRRLGWEMFVASIEVESNIEAQE